MCGHHSLLGSGIHRKNPNQGDYDYGAEYKAKVCMHYSLAFHNYNKLVPYTFQKAKGDVKRPGMPDPYAYLPLNRQKLNKR